MPQDQKSSINNLIIVWQGSSWSVIAPDGRVLFRHYSKHVAIDFAEDEFSYSSSKYKPFLSTDDLPPPPFSTSSSHAETSSLKKVVPTRFVDQVDRADISPSDLGSFNHFIQKLPEYMYRTIPVQHIRMANNSELEKLARRYVWQ